MKDFTVYASGLCYASVCTTLPDEDAERRLNFERPTGIPSPWSVSSDETFASGAPNPCPCEQNPDSHRHILFSC